MDRRVKRTRLLLGNALIDLLQEKPLSKITILEVTEQADVAYSTFFRNFHSIDELLFEHLQDFLETLKDRMMTEIDAPYAVQSQRTIEALFQLISQNPKLHRIMFQQPEAQPILKAFKAEQVKINLDALNNLEISLDPAKPPVELIIHGVVAQLIGMIEWWLDNEMQPAPHQMASYYQQLVLRPMWIQLIGSDGVDNLFNGSASATIC